MAKKKTLNKAKNIVVKKTPKKTKRGFSKALVAAVGLMGFAAALFLKGKKGKNSKPSASSPSRRKTSRTK